MHSAKAVAPETAMIAKPAAKSAQPKWQKKVFNVLNEPAPQLFMGLLLMLSLFMSESWVLGNAPDLYNDGLYGTLTAVFVIFALEAIVLSLVQEGYFLSFFFWMDVVGTLSIILDIGWISELFIPSGAVSGSGSVLRATRAAKLGARYGRLLRLLRLMRFSRFLPCFRSGVQDTFEPTMSAIKRVSEQLSAVLSLRTAALVMIMVIVVPFLSVTITDYSPNAWIDNMKELAKDGNTNMNDLENIAGQCRRFYETKRDGLLYVKIESPWVRNPLKQDYFTRSPLRANNIVEYRSSYFINNDDLSDGNNANDASENWLARRKSEGRDSEPGKTEFKVLLNIDNTVENQRSSMFGIILILLVIFLLFAFTASYSAQVNSLVVQPLERMMTTLRNSAMLMLNSLKDVKNAKDEEEENAAEAKKENPSDEDEDDADMETAMLEKMVEKLARIVKHVLPGNDEIVVDGSIDKNTSSWLSQQYSANAGSKLLTRTAAGGTQSAKDYDEEQARLRAIDEQLTIVSKETLNSWEFNVLDYRNEELCEVIVYLLNILGLLNMFKVDHTVLRTFLAEISGRYVNSNTYHNFKHGCDVCHTSYRLMLIPQLNVVFTDLEVFAVLVGALAHDVGHPGVNNAFLVTTQHELALKHNDRSPLENMHCVALYDVLNKKDMNIFSGLSVTEKKDARKIILKIVLGTDMSHHFEQISKTQLFLEVNGDDTTAFCKGEKDTIDCLSEEKNRLFIMELVLHCSDISNPFKPFKLCAKWADLVVEEFFQQGDKEKELGLPVSPMCDRAAVNLCNMQMGFIEFVVAPLIIAFVKILPPLHEIGSNMGNNFEQWGKQRIEEIRRPPSIAEDVEETTTGDGSNSKLPAAPQQPVLTQSQQAEEIKKLEERMQKFKDKLSFLSEMQGMNQRKRSSFVTNASK